VYPGLVSLGSFQEIASEPRTLSDQACDEYPHHIGSCMSNKKIHIIQRNTIRDPQFLSFIFEEEQQVTR
jgi:hypothetical protein